MEGALASADPRILGCFRPEPPGPVQVWESTEKDLTCIPPSDQSSRQRSISLCLGCNNKLDERKKRSKTVSRRRYLRIHKTLAWAASVSSTSSLGNSLLSSGMRSPHYLHSIYTPRLKSEGYRGIVYMMSKWVSSKDRSWCYTHGVEHPVQV